jgi:hypothetical protein
VYWKCQIGETTSVADYTAGRDVLSREGSSSEVRWSISAPMPKPVLEKAFGIKLQTVKISGGDGGSSVSPAAIVLLVAAFILLGCIASYFDDDDGSAGGTTVIGGGVFSGGK